MMHGWARSAQAEGLSIMNAIIPGNVADQIKADQS